MDLSELERLALGDRSAALASLMPGTAEHDYWRGIFLQHAGRLDEVDAILKTWRDRHGDTDDYTRLWRRQLLARARVDIGRVAKDLLRETGTSLEDRAEVVVQAQRFPTRLDPARIERRAVLREAVRRRADLEDVEDVVLADIVRDPSLIPDFERVRRPILKRLRRADLPGVVDLVVADLADEDGSNGRFGEIAIHSLLTRAQLDEVAERFPAVRTQASWVDAVLRRLAPPPWVDVRVDDVARAELIDRAYAFARDLPLVDSTLKATLLFHRLELDRRAGVFDRGRFRAYLELPRSAPWSRADRLRSFPGEALVAPERAAAWAIGLEPIGNDEPLVRDYLSRFLLEEDVTAYAELLDRDWLAKVMATARLLAGIDAERAVKTLSAGERDALRDRVDIELAPQNRRVFGANDDVTLEVDVKNVRTLEVKVFRIDALAYWIAKRREVDTTIDLDGMVPSGQERTLSFDAPAIRRQRVRIDLPECKRPGTYVIELIGNGRSSRALIKKGTLRHLTRTTAAGTVVTITDEDGIPLPAARLWLGARELVPRSDAGITIPFATDGAEEGALLVHRDVVERATVARPPEEPSLEAGFFIEREAIVANQATRLVCRPRLSLGGAPVSVALLEDAAVEVAMTTLAGTSVTRTWPVALRDDDAIAIDLNVPDGAVSITARLRARLRIVSRQETIDLDDEISAPLNGLHASEGTAMLHLARVAGSPDRFVLSLLGKTGEPLGGRAVAITLRHRDVKTPIETTLESDEDGAIDLGTLDGAIRDVTAVLRGQPPLMRSWVIERVGPELPKSVHVVEGDPIVLPRPADADLSLLAVCRGAVVADASRHLTLGERTIRIDGLAAGEYALADTAITVVPRAPKQVAPEGAAAQAWVRAGEALFELPAPVPLVESFRVDGSELVLRIANATAATRVCFVATRYLPDPVLPLQSATARPPIAAMHPRNVAAYISGRDIGDEYRYVLDRRNAARRSGMMLEKPSLLLHPWALRTTSTARQEASRGQAYGAPPPAPAAAPALERSMMESVRRSKRDAAPEPSEQPGFATLDFLASAATVVVNVRADESGVVRLAIPAAAQTVQAIVTDPALAGPLTADVALAAAPLRARDLRLRLALEPDRHFVEQQRAVGVPADTALVVPDVRSGKIELVDTLARAHQVLATLMNDASDLTEFAFVLEWPTLDDATRRARYSKYACHELHLFLWKKDRAFFDAVVRPSLADKREKTFVDRFLLGEDLAGYLEPWAFGRLNSVERVLLGIATGQHASIARLLGDEVDRIPPDPAGDAKLITTLLGAGALDVEAAAAPPSEDVPMPKSMATASGGFAGPPGFGADMVERERGGGGAMYRAADKTKEWAEVQWWKRRLDETYDQSLLRPNRFWRDFARSVSGGATGPFLSPYLGDCAGYFADAMCALAFLDLPFQAAQHTTVLEDTRLTITPRSHVLAARSSIVEIASAEPSSILIGQSYVRSDDRWEYTGNEQREKRVTGPMLTGVVYRCQVVVTNPTSATERLDVLLQIPQGAMPVDRGFITRTIPIRLAPYATQSLDYAFYFPLPGTFTHFPAHVSHDGELRVAATARPLEVARSIDTVDLASWSHVSQHGTLDDVIAFLDRENIGRIDLGRIAWRMHDKDAFVRVTERLTARHVYDDHLWAYALEHRDRKRAAEWLRHRDELQGETDPAAMGWYQHLEYAPLINARAHQLGAERRILNDGLDAQYHAFLDVVAHRPAATADDRLAAVHYLLCMDRVEEAIALLARVEPNPSVQYAYLAAYVACYQGDLATARRLATPGLSHPVDRWRARFEALVQMLDEVEGAAAVGPAGQAIGPAGQAIDPDSRDQKMAALAAAQPALDLSVAGSEITLTHANLAGCQVRFFKLDIELVFSRSPFVQGDVERFSFIEPGTVLDVPLSGAQTTVPIPAALRGANVVIEATAPGLRRSVAHYAHDLGVQVAHAFGQLKVVRASTGKALPAVYVKVYVRERGGRVVFYKDGYTDLRGRLDYATLSTNDLDTAERFAILIASDDAGATITEAPPPTR